jgi:hypothetical protein
VGYVSYEKSAYDFAVVRSNSTGPSRHFYVVCVGDEFSEFCCSQL